MPLIDALNRVLKYGRAPEDLLRMGAKAAQDERAIVRPENFEDARLQDVLQEHDDPREVIVRKNREEQPHPTDFDAEMERLAGWGKRNLIGSEHYHTPDGELHFNTYEGPTGRATTADWYIVHPATNRTLRNYYVALSPAEADHIKATLPDLRKMD